MCRQDVQGFSHSWRMPISRAVPSQNSGAFWQRRCSRRPCCCRQPWQPARRRSCRSRETNSIDRWIRKPNCKRPSALFWRRPQAAMAVMAATVVTPVGMVATPVGMVAMAVMEGTAEMAATAATEGTAATAEMAVALETAAATAATAVALETAAAMAATAVALETAAATAATAVALETAAATAETAATLETAAATAGTAAAMAVRRKWQFRRQWQLGRPWRRRPSQHQLRPFGRRPAFLRNVPTIALLTRLELNARRA